MKKLQRIVPVAKFTKTAEVKEFMHDLFGNLTVISDGKELYFIGKEVAGSLGYKDTNQAIRKNCKYVKLFKAVSATLLEFPFEVPPRGLQIIIEQDLYRLIMRSHLPSAEDFKDWVTDEVLPSIRKTGSYSMETPQTYADALRQLADSVEAKELLEEKIKEDKPLVQFAHHVSESADSIDFEIFAKIINDENIPIGRNRLFKWMRDNNFLMESNMPYQYMVNRGYFTVVETIYNSNYGKRISCRTMITGIGQVYFCTKLKEEFGN